MRYEQKLQNSCYTVYPKDKVSFRYASLDILHRGDDDDDGDDDDNDDKDVSTHFSLDYTSI
jgi:hypothetical protein